MARKPVDPLEEEQKRLEKEARAANRSRKTKAGLVATRRWTLGLPLRLLEHFPKTTAGLLIAAGAVGAGYVHSEDNLKDDYDDSVKAAKGVAASYLSARSGTVVSPDDLGAMDFGPRFAVRGQVTVNGVLQCATMTVGKHPTVSRPGAASGDRQEPISLADLETAGFKATKLAEDCKLDRTQIAHDVGALSDPKWKGRRMIVRGTKLPEPGTQVSLR